MRSSPSSMSLKKKKSDIIEKTQLRENKTKSDIIEKTQLGDDMIG